MIYKYFLLLEKSRMEFISKRAYESWNKKAIKTTEDALDDESTVITSMLTQYNKGVNQYATTSDRSVILEQLKALRDEVYSTGNADYAGRYIFTGYRTESSLTFQKDTKQTYEITEQLSAADLKKGTHVDTTFTSGTAKDLTNLTSGTVSDFSAVTEQDIANNTYYKIRLSYDNCDAASAGFTPSISYYANATDTTATTITPSFAKSTDIPSPYDTIGSATNTAVYLSDTGEVLLSPDLYTKLSKVTDNAATADVNEAEIRVTYQKTDFDKGDLRPEHYFYCKTGTDTAATTDDVIYNDKQLVTDGKIN